MKQLSFTFLILFSIFFTVPVWAESTVNLNVVNGSLIDTCLAPHGNIKPIEIVAVVHRGEDESVGLTKQGEISEKVFSATDVKDIVKQSVRNTLTRCGYKVTQGASALKLHIDIDEFFGGARNKFLVGKGVTKVSLDLALTTVDDSSRYTFRFSNDTDLKGFSSKKLTRLEKSLNGILVDVMKQMASSQAFLNGAEDLSKF